MDADFIAVLKGAALSDVNTTTDYSGSARRQRSQQLGYTADMDSEQYEYMRTGLSIKPRWTEGPKGI